jgi:hypothetical protein
MNENPYYLKFKEFMFNKIHNKNNKKESNLFINNNNIIRKRIRKRNNINKEIILKLVKK